MASREELLRLTGIIFPHTMREVKRIRDGDVRFAHYTSAKAGMDILRSKCVWLRNSTVMNDYSEVEHGIDCLAHAWRSPVGERLKAVMRTIQNDLPEIFEEHFNHQAAELRNETYLLSISEHDDSADPKHEDEYGRLSMWRAYAMRDGVSFVFKNTPFTSESHALHAYTCPVIYAARETFLPHFDRLVTSIEENIDHLARYGGAFVNEMLLQAFRFTVQSTKHPSFKEEREWRVLYSPSIAERPGFDIEQHRLRVPTKIETIHGVPQRIYTIPFKNYPDEGMMGATIPELIDRILIGPSRDAFTIQTAYIAELEGCGVEDARDRVMITDVPLRV
jgi:hypothetical protein